MTAICIMGICGTGKSTVGSIVAERLGLPFIEGDDHHPEANIAKQAAGLALTNADREAWIASLGAEVRAAGACVFSCSALNPVVRGWLADSAGAVRYVLLHAPRDVLAARMEARADHFMGARMLDGQIAAMDAPETALRVSVDQPLNAVVADVLRALDEQA